MTTTKCGCGKKSVIGDDSIARAVAAATLQTAVESSDEASLKGNMPEALAHTRAACVSVWRLLNGMCDACVDKDFEARYGA